MQPDQCVVFNPAEYFDYLRSQNILLDQDSSQAGDQAASDPYPAGIWVRMMEIDEGSAG